MEKEELSLLLGNKLPKELVKDLVVSYLQLKSDVVTRTLERASPGKFVETVVQILQFLDCKTYEKSPKVDNYLKNLENQAKNLSDDLRITLARVARAGYTLRNKRNIAHKGEVDPNIYDLNYLFSTTQWILSEIVRNVLSTDVTTANTLIEVIQIPVIPSVEDFGDRRVVLKTGTTLEELLVLLSSYYPEYTTITQIYKDLSRRPKSTVSHVISSAYDKRYIEGNKLKGYKLTRIGYDLALKQIQE
jgi:hypothetical protein